MLTLVHLFSYAVQSAGVLQVGLNNLASVTQAVVQSVA